MAQVFRFVTDCLLYLLIKPPGRLRLATNCPFTEDLLGNPSIRRSVPHDQPIELALAGA